MKPALASGILGAGLLLAATGASFAGGLERSWYNVDLLFDPSRFAAETSATYVMPQRKLNNVVDNPASGGNLNGRPNQDISETENYWMPRVGLKFGYEAVDCMVDYSQPIGAHINPGLNWAGANDNIETKVDSDNYAGTCSYKFDVGRGQFRILGGAFYQQVEGFKERLVFALPAGFPISGIGRLDLESEGWGWRAGVAYEIPEIALRASLVYNSAVKHDDISGSLDLTQVPGQPAAPIEVFGNAKVPQSVELKLQSGIAPGWLAFGSIKWIDWSVLQTVPFCSTAVRAIGINNCVQNGVGFATSLDLLYKDGWSINMGIGHAFTETISGAASITWDRGTSTGLGAQTDTWTFAAGGSFTPNENLEIRLGGALGILTSGSSGQVTTSLGTFGNEVSYDFGNDLVAAISASAKLKF
jgi:long-chain fatty acid transport protein